MQVIGIGTDIIEIDRIAWVIDNTPRFVKRVFTPVEIDYCKARKDCYPHFAARFAAKEAVGKAIGRSLSWQDVEIINGSQGKPEVRLSGLAQRLTEGCLVMITMSHSKYYATATALLMACDE